MWDLETEGHDPHDSWRSGEGRSPLQEAEMSCPICGRMDVVEVSVYDPQWHAGHNRCQTCGYRAFWAEFAGPVHQCWCGHEDLEHGEEGCRGLRGEGKPCHCRAFKEPPEEYQGCIATYEHLRDKLTKIEGFLARRLKLDPSRSFRDQLIDLDKVGSLPEDEVVAEWHADLAHFLIWDDDDRVDSSVI